MQEAAGQIVDPKVHADLLHDFLCIKASELLGLGIDAILSARIDGDDPTAVLRGKIIYAQGLIDTSLQERSTLSDLAHVVDLSPATFSAEFRKVTGPSIAEYVSRKRMEKTRYLLQSTPTPLKQVAFELEYNHTSNFCVVLKRHFGLTPGEAREAAR